MIVAKTHAAQWALLVLLSCDMQMTHTTASTCRSEISGSGAGRNNENLVLWTRNFPVVPEDHIEKKMGAGLGNTYGVELVELAFANSRKLYNCRTAQS